MEYRELFKQYYKIDFDSNWEIHHIDLNHQNDNINNLMLLPSKLHKEYHNIIWELQGIADGEYIKISKIAGNNTGYIAFEEKLIKRFYEVMWNVSRYTEFMMYLKTRNSTIMYPDVWNIRREKGLWLY